MYHDLVNDVIEQFDRSLGTRLSAEFDELADCLYQAIQNHLVDNPVDDDDDSCDLLRTKLQSEILVILSSSERHANLVDRALESAAREADSDETSEATAFILDIRLPWSRLPHNLVRHNLDLVKKAALQYQLPAKIDPELEFEDLMSVGREALLIAAQKMADRPRENFRSYAMQVLRDAIKNHQSGQYPLPRKMRKKLDSLKEARAATGANGQDSAAIDQLSEHLNFHPDEVRDLFEVEAAWSASTLVDFGDRMEELQIADQSPDALTLLIERETDMLMSDNMTNLSSMERNIILQIYYKDLSFRETAKNLGVSLSVVKKHHRHAMQLLKGGMDHDG